MTPSPSLFPTLDLTMLAVWAQGFPDNMLISVLQGYVRGCCCESNFTWTASLMICRGMRRHLVVVVLVGLVIMGQQWQQQCHVRGG